jgi:hypothetical protein
VRKLRKQKSLIKLLLIDWYICWVTQKYKKVVKSEFLVLVRSYELSHYVRGVHEKSLCKVSPCLSCVT